MRPHNACFSRAADGGVGWRGEAPERTGSICYVAWSIFQALLKDFNFMFIKKPYCLFLIFTIKSLAVELHFYGQTVKLPILFENENVAELEVVIFYINGQRLQNLDINHVDINTSSAFVNASNLEFIIHIPVISDVISPPEIFRRNFVRCACEWMCSFFESNPLQRTNPKIDTYYPRCQHLTYFLETSLTVYSSSLPRFFISKGEHEPLNRFSTLTLINERTNSVVHEIIYVGNGLAFSKLGNGYLFFHTVSGIKKYYEAVTEEKLIINEAKFYRDFDPPPPPGVAT